MRALARFFVIAAFAAASVNALPAAPDGDTPGDGEAALKSCQAASWDAKETAREEKREKRGPLRTIVRGTGKALADEVSGTAQAIGRDMLLCFSAQENDPYERKPPKNKPHEIASFRLVDGTTCEVVKYPDGSCKVKRGFADGTIIAPLSNGTYIVGYPNGSRATLERNGDQIIVHRPDKTTTTYQKTLSGHYKISNDSLGYMGEGIVDQTGVRYDFGSFGKGTL
jgi:hypothetical protein